MQIKLAYWIWQKIINWLVAESDPPAFPMSDFERLKYEIRPGDVILVEGRTRVSDIIKTITLSSWTHSALYIGRLHDIEDEETRNIIREHCQANESEQLIVEALLGQGTIVDTLAKYKRDHLRICRPIGLTHKDAQQVISHAVSRLGSRYDVRQLLDLARFLFPYHFIPRRWRSSLFAHNAGTQTKTVCSSMLAEAFAYVQYPILPVLQKDEDGKIHFLRRNFKLYTPRDFDYSPYFDVVKYPVFDFDDLTFYRRLPWSREGIDKIDKKILHEISRDYLAKNEVDLVVYDEQGQKVEEESVELDAAELEAMHKNKQQANSGQRGVT